MGDFNPNDLTKEILDSAVRTGRISDYYLGDNCLIKEVSLSNGGYKLSLIQYTESSPKKHVMCDYIYDRTGKLMEYRIHSD